MKLLPILSAILLAGCATAPKSRTFDVGGFDLHCDTMEAITERYGKLTGRTDVAVYGYEVPGSVHVRWSSERDVDGEPLPDFEALGHEVWHKVKRRWHE